MTKSGRFAPDEEPNWLRECCAPLHLAPDYPDEPGNDEIKELP